MSARDRFRPLCFQDPVRPLCMGAAVLLAMAFQIPMLTAQSTNPDAAFLSDPPAGPKSAAPDTAVPPPISSEALTPPPESQPSPAAESVPSTSAPSAPNSPAMTDSDIAPKAPSDAVISKSEVLDVSVQKPDAESPFFTERQEAKQAMAQAGREGFGMYVPKPPHPPVGQQVKKFFHGMIGSFRPSSNSSKPALVMSVEPSQFSLAQTSELEVTLRISNAARHELEIQYPDNQRLEILVKDPQGNVVSRWSQDRAFDPREGFVEVNPKEFISYTERLATGGMKPGIPYTIEASLAHQEGYTVARTVTPGA